MKLLRSLSAVATAVVLLTGAAFAGDLAGTWKWSSPGRDGQTRESMLKVEHKDGVYTGTISGMRGGDSPISDVKVDGDNVSFSVERTGQDGTKRVSKYTGKLDGDKLALHTEFPGRDGAAPRKIDIDATRAK